jgi:transcriptional adapter 2-alpha
MYTCTQHTCTLTLILIYTTQLLADMKFAYDDTPEDIRMKHDVIRMYNARIEKRRQKKEFIAQHKLFDDYKEQALADKKRHPDDNELVARLRTFKRLRSAAEHDEFVNLLAEKQQLQRYLL